MGLGLFTVGSMIGGLATTFPVLLLGRILQGGAAALASPAALALLATEFEAGPARTRALAFYSGVQGAGGAVGVLLGGVLTEYLSWRWVLFVNVPIGLVLIPGSYWCLNESDRLSGRFDWLGATLSTIGMSSLVFGFITASKPGYGWRDPLTLSAFALAVILLAYFVYRESRLSYALLPLRLLRNRSRSGAYISTMTIGAALAGMFFFVTFFIQLVLGYSPLKNGVSNLPVAFTVAVGAALSAKLLPRIGPRNLILLGSGFVAAGLFWLSTVTASSGYADTLLPALILFAFGTGLVFVPLTTVVVTGVKQQEMGLASALLNVGQQVGGAIGLAVLATVFATGLSNEARHQASMLAGTVQRGRAPGSVLPHFASALQQGLSAPPAVRHDHAAVHAAHATIAHASSLGFFTAGLLALAGGIIARLMITLRREDIPAGSRPQTSAS
jgi:EmrB/QacA subfamily drug resistance transporter